MTRNPAILAVLFMAAAALHAQQASNAATDSPCRPQNVARFNPLASNSATNISTSDLLRHLRTTPASLITPVHH
jgi:hypothetical protein